MPVDRAVEAGGVRGARVRRVGSLIALAWRSLGRQRRRTALLVGVVAYATMAILFFWGYTDGFLAAIFQGQARFVAAPVEVETIAYHADPDPSYAIEVLDGQDDLARLLDLVAAVDGVDAVAPRLDVPALVRSPYASRGVLLRGVDPAAERAVGGLGAFVTEGRELEGQGETIVGRGLARRLDLRIGERLAIDATGITGPTAIGLIVVGIVDTGIDFVDDGSVHVHLDDARRLVERSGATTIAVAVPRGREQRIATRIDAALSEAGLDGIYDAYSIEESMGSLARGLESERAQILPLGLLFSAFAAVAVTSSVVVSVLERTREFGVMMALGFAPARLAWLVTLEAVLASSGGFVLGTVIGYALLFWMQQVNVLGPFFSNFVGSFLAGLAVGNDIRTEVRAEYLIYAGATVALAALFAVLTPARTVRTLVPAEAMRSSE